MRLLQQGQWFSIGDPDKREPGPHKDDEIRIYMMGNPVIWWGNLGFIALYAVIYVWNFVSSARGVRESAQEKGGDGRVLMGQGGLQRMLEGGSPLMGILG